MDFETWNRLEKDALRCVRGFCAAGIGIPNFPENRKHLSTVEALNLQRARAKDSGVQRDEDTNFPFAFSDLSALRQAIDLALQSMHHNHHAQSDWPRIEQRLRRLRLYLDQRLNRAPTTLRATAAQDREAIADLKALVSEHARAADQAPMSDLEVFENLASEHLRFA